MSIDLTNKDVLQRLRGSPEVLRFLLTLKPDELESMRMLMGWPASLLVRFRDDPTHLTVLHKVWDLVPDRDAFMRAYLAACDDGNAASVNMLDAFSTGQLSSKGWLIDELAKLNTDLGTVWTLCGWIGTLAHLMFIREGDIRFEKIRSFDIDENCAKLADTLNRPYVRDGWRFKAATMDVNRLSYDRFEYKTLKYDGTEQMVTDSADTIINTSCDHMGGDDTWWHAIPKGRLVVLQNNDYVDNDQHDNCVRDLDSFKGMYGMSELLYSGVLECELYNRFMLIGRK